VKDRSYDEIDKWITYLTKALNRAEIINECEEGLNAVHMAAIRNDSKALEILCDLGGGMCICMFLYICVSQYSTMYMQCDARFILV